MNSNVQMLLSADYKRRQWKAYFPASEVADLELSGTDCVSHTPAGCSVLLTQPGVTITFSAKGQQLLRSNLVLSSLLHMGSCVTRSPRHTAEVFLPLTDAFTCRQVISPLHLMSGEVTVSRCLQILSALLTVHHSLPVFIDFFLWILLPACPKPN